MRGNITPFILPLLLPMPLSAAGSMSFCGRKQMKHGVPGSASPELAEQGLLDKIPDLTREVEESLPTVLQLALFSETAGTRP